MARLLRLLAVLLVPVLVLSACGGGDEEEEPTDEPTVTLPSPDVEVPEGVELTEPGAELRFGQPATVAYEANPKRGTVLRMTVRSVTRGSIRHLSMYNLDDRLKASVPYYVRVAVANVGDGALGGSPIPLWAVDDTDTLIQASSFTNDYRRCPSTPLPAKFGPGARTQACLVYLIPNRGKLTGVSFRPLQAFAPIEWTGKIGVAKDLAKGKKKAGKGKKKR